MSSSLHTMDHSQSFTARRQAASNLPSFQLPPPDLSAMHAHKFPYQPSSSSQAVASVLTPPTGLSNDLSSSSSGSSGSTAGIAPYNPQGYWPQQQNQNYTFSGTATSQMPSPYPQYPLGMGRQLYSPSIASFAHQQRSSNSPASADGLPPPPYEISLPSFQTSGSGGGSGLGLPALAPQQQQQQMNNLLMNSQQPASQAPQQGAIHTPNNYGGRPPPTPTYSNYAPSSTPHQQSFPAYTSPAQTSPPITSSAQESRLTPVASHQQHSSSMHPPTGQYQPRPYGGYALPAMSAPIMSNMHNPGNQMSMVGGGLNIGQYQPQHMQQQQQQQHMYGQHQGQTAAHNDRPFKCDQCPQSFNRNHDLKRHKRIHLAVKPFPCTHCEKSFSRKDALKRHILVKGCGKTGISATTREVGSQSPTDKNDVLSDGTDDSPRMSKIDI